jgi:DNA-binding IclR family transcriptional regulator
MNYLAGHPGCSIMQIVRATGADRRHVQRMMRSLEKITAADFCRMADLPLAA